MPLATVNCTCHAKVHNRGVAYVAEGSHVFFIERLFDGQRVTVAIEGSTIGNIRTPSDKYVSLWDVGIEAGVHVVLTLCSLYLITERLPVGCIVDGEEIILRLFQEVQRRLTPLHIHINVIVHARAREVHNLVALSAVVVIQLEGQAIDCGALAVPRDDAQHHLGAVVPNGTVLVLVVPRHAHAVGTLVLPLGRVVGDAQQVQTVHHARGTGGAVVVPAPLLGDGTAHAVGQFV